MLLLGCYFVANHKFRDSVLVLVQPLLRSIIELLSAL